MAVKIALKNEARRTLPNRRPHVTQKVRIAGQRTLYISVHHDEHPADRTFKEEDSHEGRV